LGVKVRGGSRHYVDFGEREIMTEPLVLIADHGAVRLLTLNRPQARNALSRDLIRATYAALTEADADDSVRAVLLTGADPAFCAGVDLKEAQRDGLKYFQEFRSQSCIAAVAKMRTPIVGAINGATFTGGLEMALGCDFLIASERAVFADTHARVGILPAGGMTARLPQVVGLAMARRLSMTGEVVDAARAEHIGLVTEVVPHEKLIERALELAAQIAEVPGPTMLGLKEIYTTGAAAIIDPALASEEKIAFAQHRDFDGLGDQFRKVSERNKRQIDS
jgi:enoyl-CoA hydratase/carnithine racemase